MPLHPDTQQIIRKVEELSGRMVYVTEDPELKVMATVSVARGAASAHILRYRPGSQAVDYLLAYQLGFVVRLFSCPPGERWEAMATSAEQSVGIEAMGLADFDLEFARAMGGNIMTQLRTQAVGARVDDDIRKNLPALWEQQKQSIRAQLSENHRALAPEIRQKFPKPLVDANTTMNAAFAIAWSEVLRDPRFAVPYKALGYAGRAGELLASLQQIPDDPRSDRALIELWAKALGLNGAFHFEPHSFS